MGKKPTPNLQTRRQWPLVHGKRPFDPPPPCYGGQAQGPHPSKIKNYVNYQFSKKTFPSAVAEKGDQGG